MLDRLALKDKVLESTVFVVSTQGRRGPNERQSKLPKGFI